MQVLVTGATGFLGGAVARRLAKDGHEVVGTGRSERQGKQLIADGIEFHAADIRNALQVNKLVRDKCAVVHCAALSSPWGPASDFVSINVHGTLNVVNACSASDVRRLVHISTPGIYFDFRDRLGVREDEPLPTKPANDYVRTKLAAETVVQEATVENKQLTTITLRPRAIYGPGDTVVLPRLIRALEAGRLPRIGKANTVMDLTYIDHATDAVALALEAPDELSGRTYNITDGNEIALWPFVDELCTQLNLEPPSRHVSYGVVAAYATLLELLHRTLLRGREPLMTRYSAGLLARSLTLDISEARRDLGYAPHVTPEQGMARFAEWWRMTHGNS